MTDATLVLKIDSSGAVVAEKNLASLTKAASTTESQTNSLASSAVKLAAAYVSWSAISSTFQAVIKSTSEFEASISELSSVTGATGKDLEYLSEQSKEIGRSTTLSASQAATAFKLIASAKPDLLENAEALNAVTRSAVTLAEAAKIDLAQAADSLGTSLNQFGADADEATRFINVLAAGAKFGSSEIAETAIALKNSGAAAAAIGVSFESANAAIQALAAGGIRAGEAGTGLRNIMLKLESDANDKLKPSINGLSGAIKNLAGEQLSITELTEMFGKENVVAAQTIIKQADSLAILEKNLTGTNTAAEQAATNVDNFKGDMLRAGAATEALQIALGEKLLPSLRDGTQSFSQIALAAAQFTSSDEFDTWMNRAVTAAELLATVVGGKMVWSLAMSVKALHANILATAEATVVTNVYGQRTVLATGSQNLMTAATIRLNTALAFFGGPVGVTIMAVAAIGYFITSLGDAEERAKSLREEIDQLSAAEIKNALAMAKNEEEAIRSSIARTEAVRSRSAADERAYQTQIGRLSEIKNRVGDYEIALRKLEASSPAASMKQFYDILSAGNQTTSNGVPIVDDLADSQKKLTEQVRILNGAYISLGSSQAQIADYYRTLAGSTDEVEIRTSRLSKTVGKVSMDMDLYNEALGNAAEHNDALAKAAQDQQKVEEQRAQVMAQVMGEMRTSVADAFVGMMDSGENAFDAIAKSFENMIKKMVADWVASQIMNLVGQVTGIGSLQTGGAFNPQSAIGSIISGAGTKAAGNVISGAISGAGASSSAAGYIDLMKSSGANVGAGGATAGAGTGSVTSGIVSGAVTAGAGIVGGMAGTAIGESVFGKQANSSIGATIGSTAGAIIGGPIGAAIGGAIGGAIDAAFGSEHTMSGNAGLLLHDIPGAEADQKFNVDPFASGFAPIGFARRENQGAAAAVIDAFRAPDAALTQIAKAMGFNVSYNNNTFRPMGMNENAEGDGVFLGIASEDGVPRGIGLQEQVDAFTRLWILGLGNQLSTDVKDKILGAGDSAAMIEMAAKLAQNNLAADGSFASGVANIPYDGFKTITHKGEAVLNRGDNDKLELLAQSMKMLAEEMREIKIYSRDMYRIQDQWNGEGLPAERV